jgi:hypothetical protein
MKASPTTEQTMALFRMGQPTIPAHEAHFELKLRGYFRKWLKVQQTSKIHKKQYKDQKNTK